MKLLIVGLGSMGKRRARLCRGTDPTVAITGVDTADARRAEALDLGLVNAAEPSIAAAMAHATTFPIKNAKNRYLLYNSSEENTRNPSITKTGNRRQKNVTFGGLRS